MVYASPEAVDEQQRWLAHPTLRVHIVDAVSPPCPTAVPFGLPCQTRQSSHNRVRRADAADGEYGAQQSADSDGEHRDCSADTADDVMSWLDTTTRNKNVYV